MTGESENGEIPDFIKRDMKAYVRMREHRIHQYDIPEPDYQPTEQEQAYLNIIHDVKTTDKDADADKLTHANTGGNTHACGTPGR